MTGPFGSMETSKNIGGISDPIEKAKTIVTKKGLAAREPIPAHIPTGGIRSAVVKNLAMKPISVTRNFFHENERSGENSSPVSGENFSPVDKGQSQKKQAISDPLNTTT